MAPYEETLTIAALLAFTAFVLFLVVRFASERARERERRSRVLEEQIAKFGEARDFVAFARSEAGLAWIRGDGAAGSVARGLAVLSVVALLALAIGGALLVNAIRLADAVDIGDIATRNSAWWWGTVFAAIGAGLLLAARWIARSGRRWGLDLPPAGD